MEKKRKIEVINSNSLNSGIDDKVYSLTDLCKKHVSNPIDHRFSKENIESSITG